MMNHKLFISHSSAQKKYVEELIEHIGRDFAIVDKYTFESGQELWNEIRSAIDECDYFIYLISEESLNSDWVQKEINYVRDKMDEDQITFCSFIIDNKIDINHPSIKKWIKNTYLTDRYVYPRSLSRLLKKKIRRDIWKSFPDLKFQSHLFIGREEDMRSLTQEYYDNVDICKNSIIVSGLPHVGRKRLLREFIATKIIPGVDSSDLIEIRLSDKDSVQEFAIQLNDIVEEYEYNELLGRMKDKSETLITTIQLLNRLYEIKEHIVINDDKCIVRSNGFLTEWFLDIIKNDTLKPHLHMNIASRFTPRPDLSDIYPSIVTLQIHPLKPEEMKILFNAYASHKGLEILAKDMSILVDNFTGYPEQVIFTVDTLAKSNIAITKKIVKELVGKFDNDFHSIITEIKQDERTFQVLVLLSYFEFISYDYLCQICGEDIADILEKFHYYSLTESFGSGKQYISLNSAMVDYIKRVKFKLSDSYKSKLRKMTSEILKGNEDDTTDISYRLYAIKELLRKGENKIDERYLIPSFVLKVIVEEYYAGHDDNVIFLAYRIIKGYHKSAYEDIIRSIYYWLCCSLCRKKDPRFFDEIKYFNQSSYSYYFLNGFYYRHNKKYEKAKEFYKEALNYIKDNDSDNISAKAEHEMVIVCMILGDYDEALGLAENSYNKNPSNSYHIEAYFRCLVRSAHPNREMLRQLMDEMNNSFDSHRNIIYDTMKAEYLFFIDGDFSKAVEILRQTIYSNNGKYQNYPLRSLQEICIKRDAKPIYLEISKKCSNISLDFDADYNV